VYVGVHHSLPGSFADIYANIIAGWMKLRIELQPGSGEKLKGGGSFVSR
jgi:hypothetical protein